MDDIFITKDYKLAAYFLASGLNYTKYSKTGREVLFEFTPKEKALELLEAYLDDRAKVSPKQLFYKLHDLKMIIFNELSLSAV